MKQSCCPISCSGDLSRSTFTMLGTDSSILTNARSVHPWIVQITLPSLNQQDLEIMVEIGQSRDVREVRKTAAHATYRPATTHPQLPPPHTMMSTSSGTVISTWLAYFSFKKRGCLFSYFRSMDSETERLRADFLKASRSFPPSF